MNYRMKSEKSGELIELGGKITHTLSERERERERERKVTLRRGSRENKQLMIWASINSKS